MKTIRQDFLIAGIVFALLFASEMPVWTDAPAPQPPPDTEVERIQAHLHTVEGELLRRDVSDLSPQQRSARAQHIQVLREYRQQGLFPHNHSAAGQIPVFVDDHGTHCAVGYLIARSGRTDLVERIARSRNNAYVAELADEPELLAWLDSAGISAQEAARIQPTYREEPDEQSSDGVSAEYAVLSALSLGFGGVSIAQNLPGRRPASTLQGAYGVLIGAYGIALGVPKLDENGAPQVLGVLNTAVGTIAALLGVHTLWQGNARRADLTDKPTLTASPLVHTNGTAGVVFQFRY